MSQQQFLRELDADMAAAFVDAGIADPGSYAAPGAAPVPCTVLIDHDLASVGQIAPVSDRTKLLTLFKSEIGTSVPKGRVVVGADAYLLVERTIDDDSRTVWIARHE